MSMARDERVYLDYIQESIARIHDYTKGISEKDLANNQLLLDAVIRRLLVIGEAVKRITNETKILAPEVPWKKIAGTRDVLIHEYKAIIPEQVWAIIAEDLPILSQALISLYKNLDEKLGK